MVQMQKFKMPTAAMPGFEGVRQSDAIQLVGLRQSIRGIPSQVIPGFWHRFSPYRGWIPDQVDQSIYGALIKTDSAPYGLDYWTAVAVGGFDRINSDWDTLEIPPQQYAVFIHRGHVSELGQAQHAVFSHCLPGLNLNSRRSDRKVPLLLEHYDETYNLRTGWGRIELWVPVEDA